MGFRTVTLALLAGCVFAGEDVSSLLKKQTEAFADASTRRDQAAMDKLLDDDVLFSGGNGTVDRDPLRDKTDEVSALLKRQTQAFRDAGQRGDTATMAGYLDDGVVFVNEDGIVMGRKDFRGGSPGAPPKGVSSTVTIADWVLHYSGRVAVSSFCERSDGQIRRADG